MVYIPLVLQLPDKSQGAKELDYLGELSPRIVELAQAVKELVPLQKEGTQSLHVGNVVINLTVNIVNSQGDNKSISTGGGSFTANAPVTTGDDATITSTTTTGATGPSNEALNQALAQLTALVEKFAKEAPSETAEDAKQALAALSSEAKRSKPRQEWYELSGKGLKDAAKAVVSIGPDIAKAVDTLLKLLTGP